MGEFRGKELYRPAAHQAQGAALGEKLLGAAQGGTARRIGGADGSRGAGNGMTAHWRARRLSRDGHGQQNIPPGSVRQLKGRVQAVVLGGQDDGGKPPAVQRHADAVRARAGRVHGKGHPQRQHEFQQAPFTDTTG